MRIIAISYCLPESKETLDDLLQINPAWDKAAILSKTGIVERCISSESETAFSLAHQAGRKLLTENAGLVVGGLIYVTQSTVLQIPTLACRLQHELKLSNNGFAFDINQGCAGFIYGLVTACSLMSTGNAARVLLICADTYTKTISKHDRTCRPIFSDGATATLIEHSQAGGVLATVFMTDGAGAPNLCLTVTPRTGANDPSPMLRMDGAKVFVFTMSAVPDATRELLKRAAMSPEDIDIYIYHQASKLVLDNIQSSLRIPDAKMVRHYEEIGNTVSSTIPLALENELRCGRIRPGMTLLMMGFGVGYSLAGCIWRV